MANFETTFGSLETDERFKKLERSLKLAQLKKEHNKKMHFDKMTSWPSISSINVNRLNSNCMTSSQISTIGSEILACSDNTRNILSRKKIHNNNKQKVISTSSVKQDNYTDRFTMPFPRENTVYCTFKKPQKRILSSDCEKTESTILNNPMSCIRNTFSLKSSICESADINIDKEYSHSFVAPIPLSNDSQKVDRMFSRWRVLLNDQHELIIKGTLECGKVARSKSIIRRYTATCVESKFRHKYGLQGNIVDERNELPDYIRGKFYNGFPDDWENVYQIWRSYISQGCPMTFHWPTTITDSDDDLKSELTDLTYTCQVNNKTTSIMRPYKNEYVRSKSLSIKKSPEKKEMCNFQNLNERNCLSIKPSISNKDTTTIVQTKNTRLTSKEDREDIKINPMCHSTRVNKLKDILQEDKLKIIIDNLVDRNCSPEYIHKIIEMFDCLDYVISYKIGSEHKYDSRVSANYEIFKTSETIPLQQTAVHNSNVNTKNVENGTTEIKNYIQCTNLEYGNIRNDSNPTQLSNSKNSIQLNYNKDLDKSESETYTGIPKVSIKRIFKTREALGKTYKRKMRKKIIRMGIQNHMTNPQYNTKESKFKSGYTTIPITNSEQNLLSNESCISVTKNETMNTKKCQKFVTQEPQEITFSTHQKNNSNIYEENKSTFVQKKYISDPLETQKINFIKEQKVPHKIYENVDSRFIADVDITNSDIDVISINTNKQKPEVQNTNIIKMQAKSDQNVINNENDLPEKSYIPRKLYTEFIEQLKSELPMKRAKPVIISSVPINLNLKINSTKSKSEQSHNSDMSIIENEENQYMNIPSMEKACKKFMETSIVTKPAIITNDNKSTVDNIKQDHSKTNNKNELDNINSVNSLRSMTNSTIRQSRNSKSRDKNNPKVLTTWMPKVIYYAESKSRTGLIFQGKLLNEAGHVVNRKFTTDIVLRRLSTTLIETVNHEFYQLLGGLNDNKHILPKELVRKCRNGCPAKIEQFCQIWKTLQHDNVNIIKEKSYDTSMDSLSVPVSSRGRRILPPLCYWAGERITLKDNNPMYSSGNSQKSLLTSFTENLEKNDEEKKKRKANFKMNISKKQKMFPELNEDINKNQLIPLEKTQSSKNLKITVLNNIKTENKNKSRRSMINNKQTHRLRFSSIDSGQAASQKYECKIDTNANTSSPYTMTLRKRQKTETSSNRISYDDTIKSEHDAACCSSTKKSNYKTTYMYHKNISLADDLLSEIPSSPK